MSDRIAFTVAHVPDAERFEVTHDSHTAELDYRDDGTRVVFTHTGVPRNLEGHGIGGALARAGLDWARDEGRRVVPQCPFVRAWIARHPEYADLVD
jgi:predicted GNAT family acetyltransferase